MRTFLWMTLVATAAIALADQREVYRDVNGRRVGTAETDSRGRTIYRDVSGRRVGTRD